MHYLISFKDKIPFIGLGFGVHLRDDGGWKDFSLMDHTTIGYVTTSGRQTLVKKKSIKEKEKKRKKIRKIRNVLF